MENSGKRLKKAYEKRKAIPKNRYSLLNPAHLSMLQSRERAMWEVFAELNLHDFKNLKILDIGCGSGSQLLNFLHHGAIPHKISAALTFCRNAFPAQKTYCHQAISGLATLQSCHGRTTYLILLYNSRCSLPFLSRKLKNGWRRKFYGCLNPAEY